MPPMIKSFVYANYIDNKIKCNHYPMCACWDPADEAFDVEIELVGWVEMD